MNANAIESSVFPRAKRGELGYSPAQVDEFLAKARKTFDGQASAEQRLTSEQVRRAAFSMQRKNGYAPRYVDAAIDRLEELFFEREREQIIAERGEDAWWDECRSLLSDVRGRLARPAGKRFKRRGILATGYSPKEVDAFLDRVQAMFEDRDLSMTPAEVRACVFHSQLRGYDEDQVDALLDGVLFLVLATR